MMERFLNKVVQGDCLEVMKRFPDNSIDCLISDPPYGISFMGAEWDKFNEVKDVQKEFPNTAYAEKGFKNLVRNKPDGMYQFFLPIWQEALRVLKPGAYILVMCAPRQDVLINQIQSIQDAGFNTGFSSIYWAYAEGFSKAADMGKKIDKKLGVEREQGEYNTNSRPNSKKEENLYKLGTVGNIDYHTKPASWQAELMDGFSPATGLKPAVEVVIVAQKPINKSSYLEQSMQYCEQVKEIADGDRESTDIKHGCMDVNAGRIPVNGEGTKGRFPANLISEDNVLDDGKYRHALGNLKSSTIEKISNKSYGSCFGTKQGEHFTNVEKFAADEGSFNRYFDLDAWFEQKFKELPPSVKKTFPFLIVSKPDQKEKAKNTHPTVKPLKLMAWLISLFSNPQDIILDPFCGSGTTGMAAHITGRKFICIEKEDKYYEIAKSRIEKEQSETLF